jgi:AcrR family transcriptional regulator
MSTGLQETTAQKRARARDDLRRRILEVATCIIVKEGHEGLSMRRLAEQLDIAVGTLYLYFHDKTELVAAICYLAFDGLHANMDQLRLQPGSAPQRLRCLLEGYIRFGLKNPAVYTVAFSLPPPKEMARECHDGVEQAGLQCFERFRSFVLEFMAEGIVPSGDAHVVAQTAWTTLHGVTSMLIMSREWNDFPWAPQESAIDYATRMLCNGMMATPSASE